MAECYFGIDFGACNLKAARWEKGKTNAIKLKKNQKGGNELPNTLLYAQNSDGSIELKVGSKNAIDEAANMVRYIKPKLMEKDWKQFIPNLQKDVTAEEVTSAIYAKIFQIIKEQRSNKEEQLVTAITVPVCFSEIQKRKLRQAAEKAGFKVEAVLTEPFAALLADEEICEEEEEQLVLIFDFGGSTLDFSLIQIEHKDDKIVFTEKGSKGVLLGGRDIDRLIYDKIIACKYQEECQQIIAADALGRAEGELIEEVRICKEELFADEPESVEIIRSDQTGNMHTFTFTLEEVEQALAASPMEKQVKAALDELFEDADVDAEDVTMIKPYGGSCRIPFFLCILTEYFGSDVFDYEDCDLDDDSDGLYTAIAKGAARYLALSKGEDTTMEVHDALPFYVGIIQNQKFIPIVNKNALRGAKSKGHPLRIGELQKNNFALSFYQSFAGGRIKVGGDKQGADVVYMGRAQLNREFYQLTESPVLSMRVEGDGYFTVTTQEREQIDEDEYEMVEVECIPVEIGGEKND